MRKRDGWNGTLVVVGGLEMAGYLGAELMGAASLFLFLCVMRWGQEPEVGAGGGGEGG